MRLIQLQTEKGVLYFMEAFGLVTFTAGTARAHKFSSNEQAQRVRESNRFLSQLDQFETVRVSIVPEGSTN